VFLVTPPEIARLLGQPAPPDDFETAQSIAEACATETWQWFVRTILDDLAQLSPVTLAALSAELYLRLSNDQARFVLALSHELRRPEAQRRTPRQLLADLTTQGFRAPSTMAQRRAEAAFNHELLAPPQSAEREQAARLAHVREQVRRILDARARILAEKGGDPVCPQHLEPLQRMDAAECDLAAEAVEEVEEIAGFYARLGAADSGPSLSAATAKPTLLH
jgi:signal transduction histidine kinase